jgi:M6 family metalloprotease-like protein
MGVVVSSNCQGAGPAQQEAARRGTATAMALRPINAARTAVVDVSASTGRSIGGSLTAWTTGDGADTVEHVAGTTTAGVLLVFYRSRHSNGWRVVDASAEAGRALAGAEALTSWVTKDGEFTVEHVAGRGANNAMLVFYWSPRHGRWRVVDATAESGRRVAGGLTSWVTRSGPYTVEHVAGVASDGHLTVFWWSPAAGRWKAVDATRIARGPNASGAPRALAPATGQSGPEMVVSRSVAGGLLLSWWGSALDWQVTDLAATTGSAIAGNPVTWTVPQNAAERIAVRAANSHLLVFASDAQERQLVEALRTPVYGVRRMRNVRRKLLIILWDPHKPNRPRPSRAAVEAAVLGATNSVRDYYLENSDGLYTIESAGVLGWFDSNYPPSEYWPPDGSPGRDSGAEAIRKAASTFDFARFDADSDGDVEAAELGVLFILPGAGDGGGLGRIVGEDYTTRETATGITVDGKLITWISEVSIGAPPGPGIVAHELAHLLLGLGDMYFDRFFNPYAARAYSLMDQDGRAPHLDPASKLKLGWLHPRPVLRSGRYRLADVETGHEAWALVDPHRGVGEYFLVENRWPDTSYDSVLPDRGLGIWHVIEDEQTFTETRPPGVSADNWSKYRGWPRQGIRMIRPVLGPPADDGQALWDGSDPATGYDVSLRWADGTASGFALRDISAAGPVMEATIQVPGTVVPSVRFDPRDLAGQRIRAAGLVPAFTGENSAQAWVFTQSPLGGVRVADGSTVTMRLRTGPIP